MKVLFATHGSSAIGAGMLWVPDARECAGPPFGGSRIFAINLKGLVAAPALFRSGFRIDIIVRFADVAGIAAKWGGADAINAIPINRRFRRAADASRHQKHRGHRRSCKSHT